jgi:trimeric autotransporter adhesin
MNKITNYFVFAVFMLLSLLSKSQIISTVAGNGTQSFSGDGGNALSAAINYPGGVYIDATGNLYIADELNNRIRMVNTSGTISTVMGNGTAGYTGDGGQASAAALSGPISITYYAGNFYICDDGNSAIRKVNSSGIISTVAGTGTAGYNGDGGLATAAQLNYPSFVAFDATGNMYIDDWRNNRIRKVNTSGIISTVAGNGTLGYSGDGGPATSAQINYTTGIAFDAAGNLFIADGSNNVIRKVDLSGIITTIAGTGTGGYSGDGGPAVSAQLHWPSQLTFDNSGNLYFTDYNNNTVRKINNSGMISTIAGNGTAGFSGDGGLATAAQLRNPYAIGIDVAGNIYFSDLLNERVRKITFASGIETLSSMNNINVFPNPANLELNISLNGFVSDMNVSLYNMLDQQILTQSLDGDQLITLNLETVKAGMYILRIREKEGTELIRKISIAR